MSALFRTSLTCAPEKTIVEPEIEAEPLSPRRATAAAVFESDPFPRVTLEPPALVLALDGSPSVSATSRITNVGGSGGEYHVCKDSLPAWMSLVGSGRGELGPGEEAKLDLVVDAALARHAAAGDGPARSRQAQDPPAVCAVLRVEVDGGGEGALFPVLCLVAGR